MQIASYGAGTNSTAMIIELLNRGEQIDYILFADTGGERPETYEYVNLFGNYLTKYGKQIITVHKIYRDGTIDRLEERCLRTKYAPSIVYGRKACSLRYKVAPQNKFMNSVPEARSLWKCGTPITKFIGYDAGEPGRAKVSSTPERYRNRYPLIDWHISRKDCERIITAAGLPLPGKSSCFFCPNMKDHEILALSVDLQNRAIALEKNANWQGMIGLGRTWKWENLILSDRKQEKFDFRQYDIQLPCECYD